MPINITTPFRLTYDVSALTQATANSNGLANASLIAGMTITPDAGTYSFAFTGSLGYATSNVNVYCAIYLNGTQYGTGEYNRGCVPFCKNGSAADRQVMAISGIITTPGAQAVEVRWYSGGGAMTCDQRCFTLVQVG